MEGKEESTNSPLRRVHTKDRMVYSSQIPTRGHLVQMVREGIIGTIRDTPGIIGAEYELLPRSRYQRRKSLAKTSRRIPSSGLSFQPPSFWKSDLLIPCFLADHELWEEDFTHVNSRSCCLHAKSNLSSKSGGELSLP